jgi:hypothetical protein
MDDRGASLAVAKAMVPRTVLTRMVTGPSLLTLEACTQGCPESAAAWAMLRVLVLFVGVPGEVPGDQNGAVVCANRDARVRVAIKDGRRDWTGISAGLCAQMLA